MLFHNILPDFIPVLRDIHKKPIIDFSAQNPLKRRSRRIRRPAFPLVRLTKTTVLNDLESVFASGPYNTIFSDPASRRAILYLFQHLRVPKPLVQELDDLKQRHHPTYLHILAVSALAAKISMDVPQARLDPLHAARLGLTHDMGKSRLPDEILEKKGPLTQTEFRVIQTHPVIEYHLLSHYFVQQDSRIAGMSFTHHERLDGSGYPRGIRRVNEYVQAIIPCDVFDALTGDRPYRSSSFTPRSALNLLWEESHNCRMNRMFVMCLVCYMRREKPRFEDLHISEEQRDAPPLINYYGLHLP